MSLTEHIAAQGTDHGVPHALAYRALGVAPCTFYARRSRPRSPQQRRRERVPFTVGCSAVQSRLQVAGMVHQHLLGLSSAGGRASSEG